jgi:hypothetical protein
MYEIFIIFFIVIIIMILLLVYSYSIEKVENKPHNTIVILCDQLIAWHRLPIEITSKLKGYQSFKRFCNYMKATIIHRLVQLYNMQISTTI